MVEGADDVVQRSAWTRRRQSRSDVWPEQPRGGGVEEVHTLVVVENDRA